MNKIINKPVSKFTSKNNLLNTLVLTAAFGLSASAVTAFAEEMDKAMSTDMQTDMPTSSTTEMSTTNSTDMPASSSADMQSTMPTAKATYTNDWKTPEGIAFDKLDKSGNGLLLPNEASKGKAFNKKTFTTADANNDGTIDVNEYAYYKTGKWPENYQPANSASASANTGGDALTSQETLVNDDAMKMAETDTNASNIATNDSMSESANDTNADGSKRPMGVVIDDSMITTKAKAKILATKDLKSMQISVETRQGEVTLSGAVDNEAVKLKAEQVVSEIEGVKSVKNGLEVKS